MFNKKLALFLLPVIVMSVLLASSFSLFTTSIAPSQPASIQGSVFSDPVCFYTTGDFEGRESQAHNGELELIECKDNVVYNTGLNSTIDYLFLGGGEVSGNFTVLHLCNSSQGTSLPGDCGVPVATQAEAFNAFDGCGLSPIKATTIDRLGSIGNVSISHTFTSTCDGIRVNATRLANSTATTSVDQFAGLSFTDVNMNNNDQLTINYSVNALNA